MKNEYLIFDMAQEEDINAYNHEKMESKTIGKLGGNTKILLTVNVKGEDEDAARHLSSIHDDIMQKFRPTVLSCGCAEYFNKRLYPVVNEFERRLRKLLYLKSGLQKPDKNSSRIKDLEAQDLGKIFEMLFSDEDFVKTVKTKINEKTWKYTKAEILKTISDISENTVWDLVIGNTVVPTLKENFVQIKDYRNDIMHAHNISAKTYREICRLFAKVNSELELAINSIIDPSATVDTSVDIGEVLGEAMQSVANTNESSQTILYVVENK